MEPLHILERVKSKFGDRILEISEKKPDPFAVVDPKAIVEICRFAKDDPELAMDCLSNETGVDYKDRIEVVYHLFSYQQRHGTVLKIKLPRDNPSVETLENVWKSA
ncbi:MAG: hypothetical protein JWM69_465, partial [Candidatus Binatus sp.]|nr:hypothetical protein [Candidatus Binatus sp.]